MLGAMVASNGRQSSGELFQDLGNRPMVVVRSNPDAYTD